MWLSEQNRPDFRTINRFRSSVMRGIMEEVFSAAVELPIEEGYVKRKGVAGGVALVFEAVVLRLARAGNGWRVSAISWQGDSSKHTFGRLGSSGSAYKASTSSMAAINSLFTSGRHHSRLSQCLSVFFSTAGGRDLLRQPQLDHPKG